jgi:hypothetical protein
MLKYKIFLWAVSVLFSALLVAAMFLSFKGGEYLTRDKYEKAAVAHGCGAYEAKKEDDRNTEFSWLQTQAVKASQLPTGKGK